MHFVVYIWLKCRVLLLRGASYILSILIIRPGNVGPTHRQAIPGSAPEKAAFFFPPSYSKDSGHRHPVYIHIHGGGFVCGPTCDDRQFCHYVAKEADCVVISVAYRFAPEYPYPTALQDCQAAVQWILKEYQPTHLVIGGYSAGGTLALGTVQLFQNTFDMVMATYPALDFSRGSLHEFKEQNPLIRNMYHRAYLRNTPDTDESLRNPLLSPRYIPESTLPKSIAIINTENDPNHKDITMLATRLKEKQPSTIYKYYAGAFHGFMNVPDFFLPEKMKQQKWDAIDTIVVEMKRVFSEPSVLKK
ncbi:hypothetical protein INT43_008610 [Umbelopsis isabellina]|uniref:Alpha/beta hydrolase fold-3 domain-containing protein n=1 Tax=Mortierella isabellina TaxID=91625 RepID=A0A8H7UIG9_MORIS|nr:hypothetical protein INT43_008610 [Umbelopsis isabellina]